MSLRSLQALCLTSFFIADVRDGLGPFLGIFLTQHHWRPDDIGLLMTAGGVAGLLATLPAGFITDASRNKRLMLAILCIMITGTTQPGQQRRRHLANRQRHMCGIYWPAYYRDHSGADGARWL